MNLWDSTEQETWNLEQEAFEHGISALFSERHASNMLLKEWLNNCIQRAVNTPNRLCVHACMCVCVYIIIQFSFVKCKYIGI